MKPPTKPFATYKWRWLSVLPTEGLLEAPVFLGVLRALQLHEGKSYTSESLRENLTHIQADTGTSVRLAREPKRNLFRNSGQYWRGTGLVSNVAGEIQLTELGHHVASGQITKDEFAALMVRNTVLPNPMTYKDDEIKNWQDANLRIKPLELILAVMDTLGDTRDLSQAFITPNELIHILIPLVGSKTPITTCAKAIHKFRQGRLDVSSWPNCAPGANDKRLAKEFLLFLKNFDICWTESTKSNKRYDQKFHLGQSLDDKIYPSKRDSFLEDLSLIHDELKNSKASEIPLLIERNRVATNALRRDEQPKFRRNVLRAGKSRCVLTRETIREVLEAAHIIPAEHGGPDIVQNGFCMRVDIHRLYDSGKMKIGTNGTVQLDEQTSKAVSYCDLPRKITLPSYVEPKYIEWRSRYL